MILKWTSKHRSCNDIFLFNHDRRVWMFYAWNSLGYMEICLYKRRITRNRISEHSFTPRYRGSFTHATPKGKKLKAIAYLPTFQKFKEWDCASDIHFRIYFCHQTRGKISRKILKSEIFSRQKRQLTLQKRKEIKINIKHLILSLTLYFIFSELVLTCNSNYY